MLLTRPYAEDFSGITVPLLAARTREVRSKEETAKYEQWGLNENMLGLNVSILDVRTQSYY